jgi:hypothetical protein
MLEFEDIENYGTFKKMVEASFILNSVVFGLICCLCCCVVVGKDRKNQNDRSSPQESMEFDKYTGMEDDGWNHNEEEDP